MKRREFLKSAGASEALRKAIRGQN